MGFIGEHLIDLSFVGVAFPKPSGLLNGTSLDLVALAVGVGLDTIGLLGIIPEVLIEESVFGGLLGLCEMTVSVEEILPMAGGMVFTAAEGVKG